MKTPSASDCGRTLVFHGPDVHPNELTSVADEVLWRPTEVLFSSDVDFAKPVVVIADESLLDDIAKLRTLPEHVVVLAGDAPAERALASEGVLSIAGITDVRAISNAVALASRLSCAQLAWAHSRHELDIRRDHENQVMRLGVDLMVERDRALLLRRIVDEGKQLTSSDAGALLLAEPSKDGGRQLRSVYFGFDTIKDFVNPNATFPIDDTSVVGQAATTREPVVIADAYDLPPTLHLVLDAAFDQRHHYRRRSSLIVPMVDHRDRLVGVMLFMNRKTDPRATIRTKEDADRFVIPYTDQEVLLARTLASLAAASLENSRLYAELEEAFEQFVRAAVTAIDERDPATAGHSLRVAALSTALAEAAARSDGGDTYRDVRFTPRRLRELRFAALLHDFGKIAVRENVLVKSKKLPPVLWERVMARFDLIAKTLEAAHCTVAAPAGASSDPEVKQQLDRLEQMRAVVRAANEPTIMPKDPVRQLREIAEHTFVAADGSAAPYLTRDEMHYLEIPKGTLDDRERADIQSHPAQTYRYLAQIPWPEDLAQLANYASGHHEMLDGTGYPRGLKRDEIPLQTRIITVADMFDALTASDRPYKPAVPAERALEILGGEAKAGRVDADLVRIMIERRPYSEALRGDWWRI